MASRTATDACQRPAGERSCQKRLNASLPTDNGSKAVAPLVYFAFAPDSVTVAG
ncbi:hypothetical protein O9993_13775 [Vibrio lentus]|nr:hypothetical protein [Vibrio lentus]